MCDMGGTRLLNSKMWRMREVKVGVSVQKSDDTDKIRYEQALM